MSTPVTVLPRKHKKGAGVIAAAAAAAAAEAAAVALPAPRPASPVVVARNVFARDIGGIVYYIDDEMRVFKHEDVLKGKIDPEIIGTATVVAGSEYTITYLRAPAGAR
jgi:hypothetical protein